MNAVTVIAEKAGSPHMPRLCPHGICGTARQEVERIIAIFIECRAHGFRLTIITSEGVIVIDIS